MVNTTEKSTILLLCLGLDTDKTEIKKVGVKQLKEIFREFGDLKKVIVFTRKVILKAFLEYENFENAELAKNAIHETFVKNYGKARIYYSPMQFLTFSNKYLEFWDDSMKENKQHPEDEMSTKLSLKNSVSSSSNRFSFCKDKLQPFKPTKTNNSINCQFFSNSVESFDSKLNTDNFLSNKNLIFSSQPNILGTAYDRLGNFKNIHHSISPTNDKKDQFDEEPISISKVVLVSNLGHVFKNTEEIFNLFSAFGNITKILFMVNLQKALIEYKDLEYASETITNLNNLVLGETKLRVSYSKYKSIDLEKNNKNENSMQYNQVLIVPFMRNRYKSNSSSSIIPLSSTLLISFPKLSGLQSIDAYLAIEKVCKPIKTKLVNTKAVMGKTEIINMLFTFEDIQSAVYVMYKCHNILVKGALLDIFFF